MDAFPASSSASRRNASSAHNLLISSSESSSRLRSNFSASSARASGLSFNASLSTCSFVISLSFCPGGAVCGRGGMKILVEPVQHGVVPELGVLGFQDPVAFVREDQDLRVDAFALHCREELHAFANRHPVVQLAVNDQYRRVEVLHELVR